MGEYYLVKFWFAVCTCVRLYTVVQYESLSNTNEVLIPQDLEPVCPSQIHLCHLTAVLP